MPQGAEIFTEKNKILEREIKQGRIAREYYVDETRERMAIGPVGEDGTVHGVGASIVAIWTQPRTGRRIPKDDVSIEFLRDNWRTVNIELHLRNDSKPKARVTVLDTNDHQKFYDLDLKGDPSVVVHELAKIVVQGQSPRDAQSAAMLKALSEVYEANGMQNHAEACRTRLDGLMASITERGDAANRQKPAAAPVGGHATGLDDRSAAAAQVQQARNE